MTNPTANMHMTAIQMTTTCIVLLLSSGDPSSDNGMMTAGQDLDGTVSPLSTAQHALSLCDNPSTDKDKVM